VRAVLDPTITKLILDEQARQGGRFIEGVELEAYLHKLGERAEFVVDSDDTRCRGFVAFYCNNPATRRAFITLVAVAPEDRQTGLARTLVSRVLETCRERGFLSCGLEVRADNAPALSLYESLGFAVVAERDSRRVLERQL
jgi:ribosomal protein S18 acetylase RimI-like enzyme